MKTKALWLTLAANTMLVGCAEYSTKPYSLVLPSSNKNIDIVQHRGDVRFSDCSTITVLQTYDPTGKLIDSKDARGQAFHCMLVPALIEAGGRVGAAAATNAARTTVRNTMSQAQSQTNTNNNTGGNGGGNGGGGGGGNGNNGGGNGSDDGTNPGTDNHHDNGDND